MQRVLNCGVLAPRFLPTDLQTTPAYDLSSALKEGNDNSALPRAYVRAPIVLRVNSLAAGYSAVRPVVLHRLADLLNHDTLPRTPLRGSISASGDLIPLSYLASA